MLSHTSRLAAPAALALFVGGLACSDRNPGTGPAPGTRAGSPGTAPPAAPAPPEQLARGLALALGDPAFRARVRAELDRSPYREHKLPFQRFLAADGGLALAELARGTGRAATALAREADRAVPLEMYLPVPAHRRAWTGGPDVLVATAIADHDVPVAFDVHGNRRLLDPERPPTTPVIALVPVETDFSTKPSPLIACLEYCDGVGGGGGGGGVSPPPPSPGLYMTKAHFVDDFEGWLKGSPEFEVHILGQKGQTDSLTDYQCAGEKQPAPYTFDQNDLDWSGSVMLFSKAQLDAYNAKHPGQNVRVFVVEDDDTACEIKADRDILGNLFKAVDDANKALSAGNDSSSTIQKDYKRANAFQKLWAALAAFFNTNDELVGNAVEDVVVGASYPGYNWIVKGENNVTNGWINLQMK
ncbi:MAG: hypothetical protein DMD45_01985 [Gemmatimonadetes bacterium]|nr:MAG: hypothetical protein DMD45_01985 [Gemmatimonadota bacterium]